MAVGIQHEDEILGKAYDSQLMRRFFRYLLPYKRQLALALFFLLGTSLADLAGPFIVALAIDRYIETRQADGLLTACLLYIFVLFLAFLFRYGQTYVTGALGQYVMYDIRTQMFRHVQRLSLSFFDKNPVGRLVTRLTNDVDALNELLTSGIVAIIGDSVTLIGIAILLLYFNWQLALLTFVVLPVLVFASLKIQVRMRSAFRATRIRLARINSFIAENISGMSVVQLFNRERRNFGTFQGLNADYREASMQSVFYFALFFPIVGLISALSTGLIIWYGGGRVLAGTLTLGGLVAFLQYVERFFLPIRDLSEKYNVLQAAMASSERIFRLLDEDEELRDKPQPVRLGTLRGDVEFDHVWFQYKEDEWVLRDVSFKVEAGQSVAFVGATGAGKTSMISLMSRFYDVQKGRVLVDGVDVRDIAQYELRKHIGVVLQDPFLFSGTIKSNIRLHNEEISDERVRQAAKYVNADSFIQRLPQGYDEPVRERGAGLSVGQKQLLSFARAIAFNPEIMLVLDEATSSVDTETEGLIQDALAKLMQGRTSFIIAHRLSTVQNVDRIIVLHKGRIVEEGNHQELLANRGYYYRLYELQYRNQAVVS